jgi:23S rRNA pseudouridine955/2504/2580 synthase
LNPPQKTGKPAARQQIIAEDSAGQRLDNFLLGTLKGVPRSHVYRLIRSGQVRVNSGRTTPGYRLRAGDRVRVPPVSQRSAAVPPSGGTFEWLAARIVHEDSRLIVLDKPAGLAVHGGSGVSLGAIEALRALRPELEKLELVHRLDKETSGCLLIAKRRSALRTLHQLLREGRVEKRYLALVKGRWPQGVTQIEAPLATNRASGEARVRVDNRGKAARSSFRLLEPVGTQASLVEVATATGRTHQIRVHAAHLGHPLAGDERYGDPELNERLMRIGLRRMFLHAHTIAFTWPDTDESFTVSVPLPDELKSVVNELGSSAGRLKPAGRSRSSAARRRAK